MALGKEQAQAEASWSWLWDTDVRAEPGGSVQQQRLDVGGPQDKSTAFLLLWVKKLIFCILSNISNVQVHGSWAIWIITEWIMTSVRPFGQPAWCYYIKATAESCFCLAIFWVRYQQFQLPNFSGCLVFHSPSDAGDEPKLQVCCCLRWISAGTPLVVTYLDCSWTLCMFHKTQESSMTTMNGHTHWRLTPSSSKRFRSSSRLW